MSFKKGYSESNNFAYNKLDDTLRQTEENGKLIVQKGRELVEEGQNMVDISRAIQDVPSEVKDTVNYENVIDHFKLINDQSDLLLNQLDNVSFLNTVTSTCGLTNFVSGDTFEPVKVQRTTPNGSEPIIQDYTTKIREIISRSTNVEQIKSLMNDFGLDITRSGIKSPLENFTIAYEAFKIPVTDGNPASTSLIPMRESIHGTIDELLKRRPLQEKTKKQEKIISIGQQLKQDSIPSEVFESLEDKWNILNNKYLSSSKDENISRDEWQFRLNQATQFLKSLLNAIDKNKMRRKD
jgi:hypothetical protein